MKNLISFCSKTGQQISRNTVFLVFSLRADPWTRGEKMQEEVENRTLTLVVSGTKFTGRMFKAAISKYMAHRKEKKLEKQRSRDAPVVPHGKQTVKQLVGQNQGISNIEITDPSIKEFEIIRQCRWRKSPETVCR